ncbi:hypothetical protein CN327_06505 [Bacillus cereus]|uniref:hypothetical protein n=1 Tax=Bacillus nitratireducens TaxID=2026193 RepID=UPI0005CD0C99|nr:hypothetical protein [Bacillus nitratireducens]PEE16654.1 hypothetical protein CON53_17005 [Bacillus cereus]MED0904282.1 hypothetical protein [Bacillus nitratireducens]PES63965.1 hypothetical protein CN507_19440 [Bacillus cereus]PES79029.1 hypothetical protein CN509_12205 [Bacillus cereus]PET10905.1 hypothetical protein CN505_01315 [Bacillus cereus]
MLKIKACIMFLLIGLLCISSYNFSNHATTTHTKTLHLAELQPKPHSPAVPTEISKLHTI